MFGVGTLHDRVLKIVFYIEKLFFSRGVLTACLFAGRPWLHAGVLLVAARATAAPG